MSGDGSRKKRTHEFAHIDFTPMIDCMFLLLMFNMIAYTITSPKDIDVPSANYGSGADPRDAMSITLNQPKGAEVEIHIGDSHGKLVTMSELKGEISKAIAQGRNKVMIKAEPEIPYRFVHQIGQAVSSTEGSGGFVLLTVKQPR